MKANINICILLTVLIIIILILYFYINQYSNQVNIKENFDGDKFDGFYGSVGFCISDNGKIPPWREVTRTNTSDCTDQCLKDKNCQAVHFTSDLKDNYCLLFKKNNVSDSTYNGNQKKNGYDIDNNAIITKGDTNKNVICYIKDDTEANKITDKLTKLNVEKISESSKSRWQDPDFKKMMSEKTKEENKEILKHDKKEPPFELEYLKIVGDKSKDSEDFIYRLTGQLFTICLYFKKKFNKI
jgi:hypothetical protein